MHGSFHIYSIYICEITGSEDKYILSHNFELIIAGI